jgi:hypothetical protein
MTDVCKWPAARGLVIGLVPRLYVSRVSGAASANEPKERNSRSLGLVLLSLEEFHHSFLAGREVKENIW